MAADAGRGRDVALLLLRATAGLTFLFAGLEKVLGGLDGTAAWFGELGLPVPELLAPVVGWLEVLGGLALLSGFLARPFGALLAAEMVVAIVVARSGDVLLARSVADAVRAIRLELLLAATATAVALLGPGGASLAASLRRPAPTPPPGTREARAARK